VFFLAHCTFEDRGGEGPSHGYLTYLVKAGDVEAALEQLRARLIEAREEEGLFDGPARVYLEDLIEVRRLPPGGLIACYQAYLGPERTSIFKTFPVGEPRGCRDHVSRDGMDDEDDGEGVVTEPFLTFGPQGEGGPG
jgi:hypothetical protein